MLSSPHISDVKLDALKKGDIKVFNEIFNAYWQKLFAAAYSRTKDEQQAKDIVQEVFIQLWDRREELHLTSGSFAFYLLKSVKNRVINYYYKEKVREVVLAESFKYFDEKEGARVFEEKIEEIEVFVNQTIDELPKTMRTIYQMRESQLSVKEIASRLNLAEQTIKNNITEASSRLRAALKKKINDEDLIYAILPLLLVTIN